MKTLRTCEHCNSKKLKVVNTRVYAKYQLTSKRAIKNVRIRRHLCLSCERVEHTAEISLAKFIRLFTEN